MPFLSNLDSPYFSLVDILHIIMSYKHVVFSLCICFFLFLFLSLLLCLLTVWIFDESLTFSYHALFLCSSQGSLAALPPFDPIWPQTTDQHSFTHCCQSFSFHCPPPLIESTGLAVKHKLLSDCVQSYIYHRLVAVMIIVLCLSIVCI